MGNKFHATVNFEDVIDDPAVLEQAIEAAAEKQAEELWGDPEWTEPRWMQLKDIVKAFLIGVIEADAWYVGYSVPPNFEVVANSLCGAVVTKFKGDSNASVKASLLDLEAFYREFIDATPLCREWNDWPGSGIVTRYDSTPRERTFIDLDALVRNAAIYVRNNRREFDAFNADFEKREAGEPVEEK